MGYMFNRVKKNLDVYIARIQKLDDRKTTIVNKVDEIIQREIKKNTKDGFVSVSPIKNISSTIKELFLKNGLKPHVTLFVGPKSKSTIRWLSSFGEQGTAFIYNIEEQDKFLRMMSDNFSKILLIEGSIAKQL